MLCNSKAYFIESPTIDKGAKLGQLGRFLREYFDIPADGLGYLPLSVIKSRNPLGPHTIDWDEYDQLCSKGVHSMIKKPPYQFVDTSLLIVHLDELEKIKRKQLLDFTENRATPEQQQNFLNQMNRIVNQNNSTKINISDTKIGQQLGIIHLKSKK